MSFICSRRANQGRPFKLRLVVVFSLGVFPCWGLGSPFSSPLFKPGLSFTIYINKQQKTNQLQQDKGQKPVLDKALAQLESFVSGWMSKRNGRSNRMKDDKSALCKKASYISIFSSLHLLSNFLPALMPYPVELGRIQSRLSIDTSE